MSRRGRGEWKGLSQRAIQHPVDSRESNMIDRGILEAQPTTALPKRGDAILTPLNKLFRPRDELR